jgi:hypothetical protein
MNGKDQANSEDKGDACAKNDLDEKGQAGFSNEVQ